MWYVSCMPALIDEITPCCFDPLALLRPIPGEGGPAGSPPDSADAPRVRGGNAFIWLAATREKALALEEIDAGLRDESERPPDAEPPARLWEQIFTVSQQCLHAHGKDIRIALFCLEAWIRRDGLSGLASGLELLRGLLAAYRETLHPLPPDDAAPDRRAECVAEYYAARDDAALEYSPLFFAMNRHVPVATDGTASLFLHETVAEGSGSPEPGGLPETVRHAASATARETAASWIAACRRALEQCAALERLTAAPEYGREGIPFPSAAKLRRRLEAIETLLLALYPLDAAAGAAPRADAEEDAAPAASRAGDAAFPDLGRLIAHIAGNRRADNLRILRILGRRFMDTEPHSPVGYALAHWAKMAEYPLPKLLDEMGVMGEGERKNLQIFAGVHAPDSKPGQ